MNRICRNRGGRRHPIPAEKVSKCPTPLGSLSRVVAKISRSVITNSDTGLRGRALLQSEAKTQVVSEAKDNFREDDDPALQDWQPSGAKWTTRQGCPKGERGGVHQFGVPSKGNANFAWVQHFIHHLAPNCAQNSKGEVSAFYIAA